MARCWIFKGSLNKNMIKNNTEIDDMKLNFPATRLD